MPSATANRALPFPEGADVPDVPLWLEALADALDFDMHVIDDDPRPAAGTFGRVHRHPATGAWSFDTGVAWAEVAIGGPYLPTAGGALTGDLDGGGNDLIGFVVNETREKVTTVAAAGANRNLDAAVSPIHDVTLDQNVTFTFAGVDGDWITLVLTQPGALKTVAWPATVDWPGGVAPAQVAATTVVYRFVRRAGRWNGVVYQVPPAVEVDLITKPSDETVTSSTTIQDDDHLTLPIVANRNYRFGALLNVLTASTPDFKFSIEVPAGATIAWVGFVGLNFNGSGEVNPTSGHLLQALASGSVVAIVDTEWDTEGNPIFVFGVIRNGVNAGNVKVRWAQNTSSATATKMRAGSSLELVAE